MATIKDVAKKAGVSKATVSRYLNKTAYVKEETAEKIENAIKALNFIPNRIAQTLSTKESKNIALVINDVSNPVTANYVKGAEAYASSLNYNFMLCNTGFDIEKEEWYVNSLAQKQVDGIIIAPVGEKEYIRNAMERGIPFVFITRNIQGLDADYVEFDNVDGSYKLVNHLTELGHKVIGAIGREKHDFYYYNRLQGYKLALEEASLKVEDKLVYLAGADIENGYEGMQYLMGLETRPTAVYTTTVMQSLGVVKYCREFGIRIPEDVALASFESLGEFAPVMEQTLTVYEIPAYQLGEVAVKMLMERINGLEGTPRKVGLLGSMRIGQSTVPK